MSNELIIGLSGGGAGIVLVVLGFVIYRLLLALKKSKVNQTSKQLLMETKLEKVIDVLISNQNGLQAPEKAREALNSLVEIRTDNTDKITLEAQKAKALRKAIKPRAIKGTKSARLV